MQYVETTLLSFLYSCLSALLENSDDTTRLGDPCYLSILSAIGSSSLPRISNGTNSPRLALLYRQNFGRVWPIKVSCRCAGILTDVCQVSCTVCTVQSNYFSQWQFHDTILCPGSAQAVGKCFHFFPQIDSLIEWQDYSELFYIRWGFPHISKSLSIWQ